jgi:DNA-binding transcriptional MerR regulator
MEKALPAIPAKRYFTIGEVSELCAVKPYVLRYWEQEFTQLRPMKRRGNRRYYQHHEVLLIRRIRELLYEQGFTISGARNRLGEAQGGRAEARAVDGHAQGQAAAGSEAGSDVVAGAWDLDGEAATASEAALAMPLHTDAPLTIEQVREELLLLRGLLEE